MTKKNYIAIAEALNDAYDDADHDSYGVLDKLTEDLIRIFQEDNPRFNEDKFRKACRRGDY